MSESARLRFKSLWVADSISREATAAGPRAFLLLHGYQQSGRLIFDKLNDVLPTGSPVVAFNGPFPVPERTESGYRVGYSWYFYDFSSDEYLIGPDVGTEFLVNALEKYAAASGWRGRDLTLIGFSQGGYLAPFAALQLIQAGYEVSQVIGIGCQFLDQEISSTFPGRLDAIMGEDDSVVNGSVARASHEALLARGFRGEFISVPGVGHRISSKIKAEVGRLVALS